MPTYQYEALDASGKPQKGSIDASTSDDAIQQIRGQGFFPTSVREQKVKEEGGKGSKRKGRKPRGGKGKAKKKKGEINISLSFGRLLANNGLPYPKSMKQKLLQNP